MPCYLFPMTTTTALWATTAIAHPPLRDVRTHCQECLDLTQSAITHARAMGSVGATFSEGSHSVTVARAIAVTDDPEPKTVHSVPDGSGAIVALCGQTMNGTTDTARFGAPSFSANPREIQCPRCEDLAR